MSVKKPHNHSWVYDGGSCCNSRFKCADDACGKMTRAEIDWDAFRTVHLNLNIGTPVVIAKDGYARPIGG